MRIIPLDPQTGASLQHVLHLFPDHSLNDLVVCDFDQDGGDDLLVSTNDGELFVLWDEELLDGSTMEDDDVVFDLRDHLPADRVLNETRIPVAFPVDAGSLPEILIPVLTEESVNDLIAVIMNPGASWSVNGSPALPEVR